MYSNHHDYIDMKHFNKYIFGSVALLVIATGFASCKNEEDDIFESSAAERLEQAKTENHSILCAAPNGWVMQYFADNTDEGGYTFLMKFDKNTSVKIAANSSLTGNTYKEETSMFQVIADDGPVLTFNTYNSIFHQLADPYEVPSLPGDESGYGHRGDYEFVIMDASDDKMVLRGKKHGMTIIMTALPADTDWETYLADLNTKAASLFNDKFMPLALDLGKEKFVVTKAAGGVFTMYPDGGDEISETIKYPYIVTNDGIRFSETIEESGVQTLLQNEDGTFSVDGEDAGGLTPYLALNATFVAQQYTWTLMPANCFGKFATLIQDIVSETQSNLKRTFTSLEFLYRKQGSTYAMFFRHSNLQGATPYIFGEETASGESEVKFNYSTTEGNAAGKTRLERIPALKTFINELNATTFEISAENILSPSEVKLVSTSNPQDYIVMTVN